MINMPNMPNMPNVNYLIYITYALIISGYLLTFFFPQATIQGYSTVVAGLFFYIMLRIVPLTKDVNLTLSAFTPFIPMLVILGTVVWMLAINIKYYNDIKSGNVTREYSTFNTIAFFLLMGQMMLLARGNKPYTNILISLIASFQIIVTFIMQMNLEYFITDG